MHEEKPRIAYLGPECSYTYQAAVENFDSNEYLLIAKSTMAEVFLSVQSGESLYGIVPIENSTNGSVVPTLDCFADREMQLHDIRVFGEAYIKVEHYLLGLATPNQRPVSPLPYTDPSNPLSPLRHSKRPGVSGSSTGSDSDGEVSGSTTPTSRIPHPKPPRTKPLTDVSHITTVLSHIQAFGQCEAFLSAYLRGVDRQETSSTSSAATRVAEAVREGEYGLAAISSGLAAEVLGLDVLARGIQDRDDNKTRFFFLRKEGTEVVNGVGNAAKDGADGVCSAEWKTLVAFKINHREAGALADALNVFKKQGLNLTSINSRPTRIRPWHYIFFIELEGRRNEGGGGKVNEALMELGDTTEGCRWLGSWRTGAGR